MQLMALNALLLFDAIFIFFLFLVSVSCLLYYLPLVPPRSPAVARLEAAMADIESASRDPSTHILAPDHSLRIKTQDPPIEIV